VAKQLKTKVKLVPDHKNIQPDPEETVALSAFLLKQMSQFSTFASTFLQIQTKSGDLIDFELNEIQVLLEEIISHIKEKKRMVRLVILKARRKGISTWVSGRFLYKTITNRNHYSTIITHEPEATDFIFKMHKRFLAHLPAPLRPEERYNNKKILEFNTPDGKGLDSAIRVGTADKEDYGSGQLIHDIHFSELAKYPKHSCTNLLLSLLQCVPEHPDSEIIMESTARGVGGEFYDRYWNSRYLYIFYLDSEGNTKFREEINELASEDNDYASVFIPWFVFKEYQMEPRGELKLTEEEEALVEEHGLTERQIAWRRWAIVNKCNNEIEQFNQEYPENPMSAFISKSDNVFNPQTLQKRIFSAIPPKSVYSLNFVTGAFMSNPKGKIKVWDEPRAGRKYIVAGDPAEGIVGGDPSSLDVMDAFTGQQVVHFNGFIPPDQFGILATLLGMRYNNALIAIERNNCGMSTIEKILSFEYSNIYAEMIVEPPARPRKRYGWVTSKASKPKLINHLLSEFRENSDGIMAKETLEEMIFFKQHEDMTFGAEVGRHDDRVISWAIAKYVSTQMPKYQNRTKFAAVRAQLYNNKRKIRSAPVSKGAWD
jgi:hypothetical protein